MWLPKDERRLLAGYYRLIRKIGESEVCKISSLAPLLTCNYFAKRSFKDEANYKISEFGSKKKMKKSIDKYFDYTNRIKCASKHLHERGLILHENHEHDRDVVVITLTVSGYDLGRKYSRFLSRSGLWFEEYRNHWLWLIVAFIGGAIGSKIIDLIIK